jgi:hypothetical protein
MGGGVRIIWLKVRSSGRLMWSSDAILAEHATYMAVQYQIMKFQILWLTAFDIMYISYVASGFIALKYTQAVVDFRHLLWNV